VGALVVGAWGYGGAFALAGSIGLASAVLAVFLRAPGRPKEGAGTTTGAVEREAF
ncbi:MFS transporter, partial [Streptomyces sp. NPDC001999]